MTPVLGNESDYSHQKLAKNGVFGCNCVCLDNDFRFRYVMMVQKAFFQPVDCHITEQWHDQPVSKEEDIPKLSKRAPYILAVLGLSKLLSVEPSVHNIKEVGVLLRKCHDAR